jgi:hypothetical protein
MNNDLRKYLGVALVCLEIVLASCLVLLAFIYGMWLESITLSGQTSLQPWIVEGVKRQAIITVAGLFAARLIHFLNTSWIKKTNYGSRKNSLIFSLGVFILIFLSGLAGVIIFIVQRPAG